MWPSSARQINYGGGGGLPPEMNMFVLAHHDQSSIVSDIHGINASNAATALGVGVIPLLSAAPCLPQQTHIDNNSAALHSSRGGGIHLWQNQPPSQHQQTWRSNLSTSGGGGGGSSSSSTTTCQDCGNQAKKDCTHRRCRTCCKSRGFDCSTHVKSTWVPAARRRERQLMAVTAPTAGSSGSTSGSKKPRLVTSQNTATSHTSASNTPPRSFDTSSSHHHHQDASFKETLPGQVRAPAVFKCVRVTAMDDGGDDEFAYQAMVKIGGHVFKGFLYDQGVEGRDGFPNLSELHLGSGSGGGGGRNGASSSSPIIDPSDVYAASGGGFLGGSSYGNQ